MLNKLIQSFATFELILSLLKSVYLLSTGSVYFWKDLDCD